MTALPAAAQDELHRSLSHRQINMVAIGGIIGTGLFVGSGLLVQSAGPAAILSYLGMGVVVVLVMRMLGEMAVASPNSGSYAAYAARELGPWAGAMASYMVIYGGIVVIALEATIIGLMLNAMAPALSSALWALIVAVVLVGFNLLKVRFFAEAEFWIALIKVIAIVSFIALGVAALFGLVPGVSSPGIQNWMPFAPHGFAPVLAACVSVLFAYVGTEQVVILAAEAKEPAEATRRAINSVVARILIFFVGSILVVITFSPQGAPGLADGAYAFTLTQMGLPGVAGVLNIVILTSLISLTNTTVYTTSRMLFAAARRGELPHGLGRVRSHGVPVPAVLVVGAVAVALTCINFFASAIDILSLLMAFTGTSVLVSYSLIAVTQLRFRARLSDSEVTGLRVRMWFHPWGAIITLTILLGVLLATFLIPEMRLTSSLTLLFAAVCAGAGLLVQRRTQRRGAEPTSSSLPVAAVELGGAS